MLADTAVSVKCNLSHSSTGGVCRTTRPACKHDPIVKMDWTWDLRDTMPSRWRKSIQGSENRCMRRSAPPKRSLPSALNNNSIRGSTISILSQECWVRGDYGLSSSRRASVEPMPRHIETFTLMTIHRLPWNMLTQMWAWDTLTRSKCPIGMRIIASRDTAIRSAKLKNSPRNKLLLI